MVTHKKSFFDNLSTDDTIALKKEALRLEQSNKKENAKFDLARYERSLRSANDHDMANRLLTAALKPYAGTIKKAPTHVKEKLDTKRKMKSRRRCR